MKVRPAADSLGSLVDERGRGNAFDLLRLVAAIAVLVSHSLPLTGRSETFGRESLGHIGVCVFFAISGFLVSRSWALHPDLRAFALKRGLRLYPALVAVLGLTVGVLGPSVTALSPGAFWTSAETRGYLTHNLVLHTQFTLPGVFTHVAYSDTVNGSLWTLPVEVKCYALVAAFGLLGLVGRRPYAMALVSVACLALTVGRVLHTVPHAEAIAGLPGGGENGLLLLGIFATSSTLYTVRRSVPVGWLPVALALVLWAATVPLTAHRVASALLLPYAVIAIAYRIRGARLRDPLRGRDLSYGTYLFAFPVQQLVAQELRPGPIGMIATSLPITMLLAWASWSLVERPALGFKWRLGVGSTAPVGHPPGQAPVAA
jgi:peptidoglycan/LPS O-acetylase OafA/YrhL